MGKAGKGKKRGVSLAQLASKSCPLLELVSDEPVMQIACHPEQPILVCGIATGHVFCIKYDAAGLKRIVTKNESKLRKTDDQDAKRKKLWKVIKLDVDMTTEDLEGDDEENACVELLWKTRRHKGCVRGMVFNRDGSELYTIGIDKVLKRAHSLTGKVIKKVTLPLEDDKTEYTKLVKSQTHPFLLLGDEKGNIYSLNSDTLQIQNTVRGIHNGDGINDIFQYVGKSVYKFISLGQTTLAFWDSRYSNESDAEIPQDDATVKRKVYVSDDQEDEVLCGTFVNPEDGDVLVCGMGEGLLTVWKPKKNNLVDQVTRIPICKNEGIDCVISSYQDDDCVFCGCSDGNVYKVNVKLGKIVEVRKHSSIDEVDYLDLDYEYRIVSGGMEKVKIWDLVKDDETDGHESSESASDGADSGSESDADNIEHSDSEDESLEESTDSSESDAEETFIGLSKDELVAELDKDLVSSDEEVENKSKRTKKPQQQRVKKQKKDLSNKQIKNLQKHEHGIRKFEGL